jgi:hypothetical protein
MQLSCGTDQLPPTSTMRILFPLKRNGTPQPRDANHAAEPRTDQLLPRILLPLKRKGMSQVYDTKHAVELRNRPAAADVNDPVPTESQGYVAVIR